MGRCTKCGETVNWDDPNIHYGGHTCDSTKIEKVQKEEVIDWKAKYNELLEEKWKVELLLDIATKEIKKLRSYSNVK